MFALVRYSQKLDFVDGVVSPVSPTRYSLRCGKVIVVV